MEITKQMYLLAKQIVNEYEKPKQTQIALPKKTIEERKLEFKESLRPFLKEYDAEMLKSFYLYWTEHGEKDKKFRKEKEKSFNIELRLKTWHKRSNQFKEKNVAQKKEKPLSLAQKMRQDYGI